VQEKKIFLGKKIFFRYKGKYPPIIAPFAPFFLKSKWNHQLIWGAMWGAKIFIAPLGTLRPIDPRSKNLQTCTQIMLAL
jgi:hypothetical protein